MDTSNSLRLQAVRAFLLLFPAVLICAILPAVAQDAKNTPGNLLQPNEVSPPSPSGSSITLMHIANSLPRGGKRPAVDPDNIIPHGFPGRLHPPTTTQRNLTSVDVIARGSLPLSPACQELTVALGLAPLVQKLAELHTKHIQTDSKLPDLEELWVKQQLTEKILITMLEVRDTTGAINRDICETNELTAYLSARRDKKILLNSMANLVSGGIGEIAGGAFELGQTAKSENTGDLVEMLGGAMQAGLSTLALRQQQGEKRTFESDPNMLAKLFDFPPDADSDYPRSVWTYLNSTPPGVNSNLTRRAHLINTWEKLGRLARRNQPGFRRKLEQLASANPKRQVVTIDTLINRAAMLSDLGAIVSGIDTMLLELMQFVSSQT